VPDSDPEIEFYRAVEDFFATIRGVPHVLSPKDFQILRGWWRDRLPLAAVTNGIIEVMAKRRERGESDPVVSLSYCRHAVRRHARRLAEMHVGETTQPAGADSDRSIGEALGRLVTSLRSSSRRVRERSPSVAVVLSKIADQIEALPEMPPAALEEHLYSLETVLLERCWQELNAADREAVATLSRDAAGSVDADDESRARTERAIRDRELRTLLSLPRLELG
jgi:hypothetical protein